jgi:hypothetical protein
MRPSGLGNRERIKSYQGLAFKILLLIRTKTTSYPGKGICQKPFGR